MTAKYAISETSARAIAEGMTLLPGEVVADHVPPSLIANLEVEDARVSRAMMLRATDWTQMTDAPLTVLQRTEMATYRQALRDLPEQPGFPDCEWPAIPTLSENAAGEFEISIGD